MPFMYVDFMTKLMAPRPYPPQPNFQPPKLTPLRRPIAESTIGVLTSCGAQLSSEPPLGETNDISYRIVDREVPLRDLIVRHQTPVRRWALEDLNVAFPRDRLVELEAEGTIGRLAPKAISIVGTITRYTELLEKTVPAIEEEFHSQEVDLVFLFPF